MRMCVVALLAGVVVAGRPVLAQTSDSRSCTFQTGTTCWNVWGRRASPLGTLPVKVAPHNPSFAAAGTDSSGRHTALRPRGLRRGAGAQ